LHIVEELSRVVGRVRRGREEGRKEENGGMERGGKKKIRQCDCADIIQYHTISNNVISYHNISYNIVSYHTIPHYITTHHTISHYIIPYHTIQQSSALRLSVSFKK
jgi:hypothetical protein